MPARFSTEDTQVYCIGEPKVGFYVLPLAQYSGIFVHLIGFQTFSPLLHTEYEVRLLAIKNTQSSTLIFNHS